MSLHKKADTFKVARGVCQGNTIFPKLFNAALENIFKELDWENKGIINTDGERLTNLRFLDDLVILFDNIPDMMVVLNTMQMESAKVGLRVNQNKTKIVTNIPNALRMPVEVTSEYIYLGHKVYDPKTKSLRAMCSTSIYVWSRDRDPNRKIRTKTRCCTKSNRKSCAQYFIT